MRVSRAFRDTVLGSKKLHRKLFMPPHGDVPEDDSDIGEEWDDWEEANPYLDHALADTGFAFSGYTFYGGDEAEDYDQEPDVPLLKLDFTITQERMDDLTPADHSHYYPSSGNRRFVGGKGGGKGMWAHTHITIIPMRVRVSFFLGDTPTPNNYSHHYHLKAGETTLYRLHDFSVIALERFANDQVNSSAKHPPGFVPGPYAPE